MMVMLTSPEAGLWLMVYWPLGRSVKATGSAPILVAGATLDTQDAYSWSVDMVGQLESGVLLKREGTWHPSYWNSACVADAVDRYLLELTLPDPRLICDSTGGSFIGIG